MCTHPRTNNSERSPRLSRSFETFVIQMLFLPTDCLSQQAHEATAAGEAALVRQIDVEIDRLAAELWVLTVAKLRESLPELG